MQAVTPAYMAPSSSLHTKCVPCSACSCCSLHSPTCVVTAVTPGHSAACLVHRHEQLGCDLTTCTACSFSVWAINMGFRGPWPVAVGSVQALLVSGPQGSQLQPQDFSVQLGRSTEPAGVVGIVPLDAQPFHLVQVRRSAAAYIFHCTARSAVAGSPARNLLWLLRRDVCRLVSCNAEAVLSPLRPLSSCGLQVMTPEQYLGQVLVQHQHIPSAAVLYEVVDDTLVQVTATSTLPDVQDSGW